MPPLRWIYLGLALWGAVHPMAHFLPFLAANGWRPGALVEAWFATGATAGLAWDLAIASVALTVFVLAETAVRRNWEALLAIPATFLIGVSCGLPLYLYLRTRPLR